MGGFRPQRRGVPPPATVTEGVPPPATTVSSGMEWKSAVYIYGVPPPATGGSAPSDGNGVEIRRLYLPTVESTAGVPTGACFESYGRGAWFDLFFRFESRCSRDCV